MADNMYPLIEDSIQEEREVKLQEDVESASPEAIPTDIGEIKAVLAKQRLEEKRNKDEDSSDSTDLEIEEEKADFDVTGRTTYLNACQVYGLVPVSRFIKHITDKKVSLAHYGLGAKGSKGISCALMRNTYILSLDLHDNWLEGDGGEYIAEMLNENVYITDLNLSRNKLGNRGCEAICRVLQTNVTLTNIDLSGNEVCDKAAECIAKALCTNNGLRVINLAMNGLGNEGAVGVAHILQQSGTVTSIDISNNRIGFTGATLIGKALETNETLKTLKLGHNPMERAGIKIVLIGVCSESSHVTELDFSGIEVDKEFRTIKETLQETRTIQIEHGSVLSDYIIVGKPKKTSSNKFLDTPTEEVTRDNVMVIIKSYSDVHDLHLYDVMLTYDKTEDKKLTQADFLSAFADVAVELTDTEIDLLDKLLVDHRTSDGHIDISALM